jgi:hypothetical protein
MQATGQLAIEAAAGESEVPGFTMEPAYSGGLLEVGGYRHPVVAEVAGISWDRMPKIRRNHQADARVGHATQVSAADGQLTVKGLISATGAVAQEVLADSANGYPWQSSVTLVPARPAQYVPPGKTFEANGRQFVGPAYYVAKSRLTELSFVDVGGDREAQAAISAYQKEARTMSENTKFDNWLEGLGFEAAALTDEQTAALQAQFDATGSDADPAEVDAEAIGNMRRQMKADQAAAVLEAQQIHAVCEKYHHPTKDGTPIEATALAEDWTAERTELECMRHYRGENAPAIHVSSSAVNNDIVACSMLLDAGPNDGGLTEAQAADHFDAQTLEAALSPSLKGMNLRRLGGLVLQAAGKSHTPGDYGTGFWSAVTEADQVIQASSGLSTISMAGSLSNVANKSVAAAFTGVIDGLMKISAVTTASDFKQHTRYRMVGIGKPELVGSDGEIKHMTLDEAEYTNQVQTYGRMLGLSRTMLINDDLGQFTQIARMFGHKSAVQVQRVGFTQFLAGIGSFWVAGNNNAITAALDIDGVSAAEQKLLEQVDEDGDPIVTSGRYLLVPPALATTAQQIYASANLIGQGASAQPTTQNNPHAGKYEPVVSQFLSAAVGLPGADDAQWWLIASPADIPTMEIMFLNGRRSPTVERAEGSFNTLGMQWRVYLDFGTSLQEHRGSVHSTGAGAQAVSASRPAKSK